MLRMFDRVVPAFMPELRYACCGLRQLRQLR